MEACLRLPDLDAANSLRKAGAQQMRKCFITARIIPARSKRTRLPKLRREESITRWCNRIEGALALETAFPLFLKEVRLSQFLFRRQWRHSDSCFVPTVFTRFWQSPFFP